MCVKCFQFQNYSRLFDVIPNIFGAPIDDLIVIVAFCPHSVVRKSHETAFSLTQDLNF